MALNQTKTIQLLRSSQLYVPSGSGSEAKTALENAKAALTALTGRKDGEIVLARYQEANADIKSVLGIYHTTPNLPGSSAPGWTFIQDVTSSVEGLDALQREVDAVETGAGLNENGTYKQTEDEKALEIIGVQGQAANSLMSAIEKIAHAVGDADSSLATDTSKVVTGYTQVNAKITQADTTNVVNLTLTGYTEGADSSGKIAATDTLGSALGKLQGQINGMDLTAVTAEGEVITSVSQTDGKVSASKTPIKDVKLTGYVKGSETGDIAATDDVEGALSKLENTIAKNTVSSADKTVKITQPTTGDSAGKTDLSVNIDGTTLVKDASDGTISSALKVVKVIPSGTAGTDEVVDANLPTNVKEAYRLVYNGSNTAIGQQINVYKDSALDNVYLGHVDDSLSGQDASGESTSDTVVDGTGDDALCFVYQLANGKYKLTTVNVESFLQESEFKDGLSVNSSTHEVSVNIGNGLEFTGSGSNRPIAVKKDSNSENFLSVSADGVKVSGVQDAIDAVKVTTDNTGATYVNLAVDSAGRALTLTNTMQAMATADSTHQGLAEASDVKTYVDNAVAGKNVTAKGDDYVSATAANNKVTVATDVQNLTFTKGSGSTDSTLTGTAQSLADGADIATKVSSFTNARISEEIAKLDSSVSATAEANNQYSVLTGVTEADGKLTAKTEVLLAAVAKTGAAADVSVADSAGKLTATNVEAALAEIVDKADASLNSVSSTNGAIAVANKDNSKNQALTFQVSKNCAKQADGTTNMLTIKDDGIALSNVWDCGTF